jgi:hypothetical protein
MTGRMPVPLGKMRGWDWMGRGDWADRGMYAF